MKTLNRNNTAALQNNRYKSMKDSAEKTDRLAIPYITIHKSGVILAIYLIILEFLFLIIALFIRIPLGFLITPIGDTTLYTINTVIGITLFLIKLFLMVGMISQWVGNYYEVRPGKVIYKTGLLNRNDVEFHFPDIQRIHLTQNFFGKLFNYGTITFDVRIRGDSFVISNIPDPRKHLKLLENALRSDHVEMALTNRKT